MAVSLASDGAVQGVLLIPYFLSLSQAHWKIVGKATEHLMGKPTLWCIQWLASVHHAVYLPRPREYLDFGGSTTGCEKHGLITFRDISSLFSLQLQ